MEFVKRLWTEEDGQGMTEYALIIGGIALAAIVAIGLFGTTISDWFTALSGRLPN